MNQTYDEWVKARVTAEKTNDVHSTVKLAIQAQVAAAHLTADDNWNYFLSVIQGFKEHAQRQLDSLDESIWSPHVISHETMIAIKLNHAYNRGLIDALDQVMEVPKILDEAGDEAQDIVKEFKTSYDA